MHPTSRSVIIEDETQTPSKLLSIPEKSLKELMDCSKLRTDKQLTKLAKDGVIFLRAPSNNNEQRLNAMKLRNVIVKLLAKYQFISRVDHPAYDKTVIVFLVAFRSSTTPKTPQPNYIETKC